MFRIFAIFVAFLGLTGAAHAYLDPGAGSFVLQMIAAGLLAAGASIKMFWHRIKEVLGALARLAKRSPERS